MANISLSRGFTVCPEGRHIFKISDVDYNPEFGKLLVHMVTEQGCKHTERFSLLNASGGANEKALQAFSFFAKTALNNFELEEIDHSDLVGHYIGGEIVHTILPSRNEPEKTVTFANMTEKWVAEGFSGTPNDTPKLNVDLDSVLD